MSSFQPALVALANFWTSPMLNTREQIEEMSKDKLVQKHDEMTTFVIENFWTSSWERQENAYQLVHYQLVQENQKLQEKIEDYEEQLKKHFEQNEMLLAFGF